MTLGKKLTKSGKSSVTEDALKILVNWEVTKSPQNAWSQFGHMVVTWLWSQEFSQEKRP